MIKVDTAGTPVCRLHRSLTALRWTPAFPYIPHPKNPVFLSPFCPKKATDICTSLVTCQCHFYPSYRKSMFWECWVSSNLVLGVRNMSLPWRPRRLRVTVVDPDFLEMGNASMRLFH